MAFFQPTVSGGINDSPFLGTDPFISGYRLTILDENTFSIGPGSARSFNTDFVIVHSNQTINNNPVSVIDIRKVGLLGTYPVAISDFPFDRDTVFNVYAIGDSSGANLPSFIVGTGNKFLPDGYDSWRKIGSVFVSELAQTLILFNQTGTGITRDYYLNRSVEGLTYGPTVNFSIPLSTGPAPCNPFFCESVFFNYEFVPVSETDYAWVNANVSTDPGFSPFLNQSNAIGTGGKLATGYWVPVNVIDIGCIVYATVVGTGATCQFNVGGWREEMGLTAL